MNFVESYISCQGASSIPVSVGMQHLVQISQTMTFDLDHQEVTFSYFFVDLAPLDIVTKFRGMELYFLSYSVRIFL